MKRIAAMLLAAAFMLTLCACGAGNTAASAKPQEPEVQEQTVPEDVQPVTAPAEETAEEPAPEEEEPEPEEPRLVEYGEPVLYQWKELNDAEPCFEMIVPVTNISDGYVYLMNLEFTLRDSAGGEIGSFRCAECAPMYIAPGQDGIIYYSAINRSGYDYLDPDYTLEFNAEFTTPEWEFTQMEIRDIKVSRTLGSLEINGVMVNDTDREFSTPDISILFTGEDGKILCAAYGMGGVGDYNAEDFGVLHANTSCPFKTYRYWLPDDLPVGDYTVSAIGFGTGY